MATRLDKIIEKLRKESKEAWVLYERVRKNYAEYMTYFFLLDSMNLFWPTVPMKEHIQTYRDVYNLHLQLIEDIGKLIPKIRYLTARPDERNRIFNELQDKINSLLFIHQELIGTQNLLLSASNE
jgi:SepF-like predicted cell division protein (DUF552 family)